MDLYRDLLALNQYPDATPAGHINCEPEGTSYEKEENQSTVHQMIRTAPHDPLVYCAEYGVSGEDIDALGTMRITDHEEGSTNMGGKSCEVSHVTATSISTINSSTNFPMTCFSSDPKFSSESSQGELHAWVDEQEGVKLPQFTLQNLEKHTETHPVSLSSQKSDSYASCSLNSSTKVDSSVLSQQSNAKKTIRRSIGLGLTAQDRGNPCNRIVCIPHHKIVTTQGSLRYKEDLRCICMNYLAGVCREGEQCMSLHADREYIARTRTPRGPLCCAAHNDVFSREVASVLSGTAYKLRGTNGELYDVDSNFLCITESLPVAPNSVFIIEMSSICRKHMQGQCKYSKECRNVHVCRERFNFLLCPNNQTHSIIGGNFAHGNKNMIHINGNIPQFAVLQGNPNTLTSNVNGTSFLPCNTMCNNGMNTVSMPVIHLVPNYGSAQMGCNLNSVWSPSQITPSTNWANTATTVNPLMSQNFSSQNAALMNNSTNMLQPMAYTRSHFPMNEQFTGNVSYAIELQPLSDVNSVMNPQVQQQNQMQAMKSWFAGNPQQSLVGAPQIVCFQPTQ